MRGRKVIGIGFHKTGTTSLRLALEKLGYRVTGPNGTSNPQIADEVKDMAWQLLKQYDAVQDNPWPVLFREIDQWYPEAKFILTRRDSDQWIRSVVNFFGSSSTPMREWIYGVGHPKGNEDIYLHRYEQHNLEVSDYFRGRPDDLLVLDVTKGEGWEKLCRFLGHATRADDFPHVNAATQPYVVPGVRAKLRRAYRRIFPSKT